MTQRSAGDTARVREGLLSGTATRGGAAGRRAAPRTGALQRRLCARPPPAAPAPDVGSRRSGHLVALVVG